MSVPASFSVQLRMQLAERVDRTVMGHVKIVDSDLKAMLAQWKRDGFNGRCTQCGKRM